MIIKNEHIIGKVYKGTTPVRKMYGGTSLSFNNGIESLGGGVEPVQEPCFAVVDNITAYTATTYVDVFNKANSKWYKLNNLNQYEEYGIYGSSRNDTYYVGKLVFEGNSEYEWNGTEWVYVGEVIVDDTWYAPTDDELMNAGYGNDLCMSGFTDFRFTIGVPSSSRIRLSNVECYIGRITVTENWEVGVTYNEGMTLYIPRGGAYDILGCGFEFYTAAEVKPKEYETKQAPNTTIGYYSFASLEEAEEFECPWVGMLVTINEALYTFNENFQWETVTLDPANYLTFIALENGQFKLNSDSNSETTGNLYYSLDGVNWTQISKDTWTPTVNANERIWWMGDLYKTVSNENGIGTFEASNPYNIEGRVDSLYRKHNFESTANPQVGFYGSLFKESINKHKLVSAENLVISRVSTSGCVDMFASNSMTTAPSILPSKTLAPYCYVHMFSGCHNITRAPELPALSLYTGCYNGMFVSCGKLSYIKAMFTTTIYSSSGGYLYTSAWVQGVASSGTFVKNVNQSWTGRNTSSFPTGWTLQSASA